jgi:hypothetical protein
LSIRYLLNLVLVVVAGFEVVAFKAFGPGVYVWLALAVGAAVVTIATATLLTERSATQRALGVVTVVIGAWTVVASLVFDPTTVVWLGFSAAATVVALGVTGLTLHEIRDEHVIRAVDMGAPSQATPVRRAGLAS